MNIRKSFLETSQKIGAFLYAPSTKQAQIALFAVGVTLLSIGLMNGASASDFEASEINYNDERIANAVDTIFAYLEGTFGALVMVVSGLGAILSSAFGQYRAALGCLVVAVGAFILRSFVGTFFNTESISTMQ